MCVLCMFFFECLAANEPKWQDDELHRLMLL